MELANTKTTYKYIGEDTMQAAEKMAECVCGIPADNICASCGKPSCNLCGITEISTFDPDNIEVKYYCETCKHDPSKNVWGTLYWDGLVSLYS